MSNEEFFEEELETILLTDEEGNEFLFELVAELEMEGENYKVLVALDEEELDSEAEETEVEVRIMKTVYDEDGTEFLCDIEDEEEWEKVADAWQELVEEEDLY